MRQIINIPPYSSDLISSNQSIVQWPDSTGFRTNPSTTISKFETTISSWLQSRKTASGISHSQNPTFTTQRSSYHRKLSSNSIETSTFSFLIRSHSVISISVMTITFVWPFWRRDMTKRMFIIFIHMNWKMRRVKVTMIERITPFGFRLLQKIRLESIWPSFLRIICSDFVPLVFLFYALWKREPLKFKNFVRSTVIVRISPIDFIREFIDFC